MNDSSYTDTLGSLKMNEFKLSMLIFKDPEYFSEKKVCRNPCGIESTLFLKINTSYRICILIHTKYLKETHTHR